MDDDQPAVTLVDQNRLDRYELHVNGEVAAVSKYVREPQGLVFRYSELMRGFEGRRLGRVLAERVLSDVRRRGVAVANISCPLLREFIEDHPEYAPAMG